MKTANQQDVDKSISKISYYPGIAAAVFYGITSGSMSFMNKIVLTTFDYRYPEIIMLAQLTTTALVLEIFRRSNWIDIPCFSFERAKKFLLPSICFALHTILALNALSDLSIPMYNVLRRLLPLATLLLGVAILNKSPSMQLTCSILLVVFGCIIAGLGDISFHLGGYISAIISVLGQACYLVYVQKTGVEAGLSTLGVLHLNSINCIPILTIYTTLNNQLINSIHHVSTTANGFFPVFIADVLLGCVLNYSLFLCATMNSALTTSLVGVVKGVITTVIGFFTFGGIAVNFFTLSGVVLNTIGGVLYVYSKYSDQVNEKLQHEFIADHIVQVERGQQGQKIYMYKNTNIDMERGNGNHVHIT